MEQVEDLLKERAEYLLKIRKEKEKALINVPEGTLRIAGSEDVPEYFHRTDPKDVKGNFIKKENFLLARRLAQKSYDRKVLCSVKEELNAINKYFSIYPKNNAEQIYGKLNKKRQKLVEPILEPLDQYIMSWEAFQYEGLGFDEDAPELYSAKGERVRSKSEVIIADFLNKKGIPYRYECPIYLNGMGTVYPDFTVLNTRWRKIIYWEHLGMMDDPSYSENAIRKITCYQKNGIFPGENLILTYETRRVPINQKILGLLVEKYLM